MKFKHFSIEEREKIQELLWQKVSIRSIASVLGRNPSSVSREITRNIPLKRSYKPRLGHKRALEKRKCRGRKLRLKSGFIRRYVVTHLKDGYSPEQVAGRLTLDYPNESISHEAIYQYIYSQVHRNGWGILKPHHHDLRVYLKRRRKRRMKKGMQKSQRIWKPKGKSIEERPKVVDQRERIGDWEGDSMVSRKSKFALNTLVERKTGLVFITRISDGNAKTTASAVVSRLGSLPEQFRTTLTLDNGSENACHAELTAVLGIDCYSAHPYSSWERGTNENTNGLIRWYLPKGTDFATITNEEIARIELALNSRPRKRLGWRTPLEAMGVAIQC